MCSYSGAAAYRNGEVSCTFSGLDVCINRTCSDLQQVYENRAARCPNGNNIGADRIAEQILAMTSNFSVNI